MFDEIGSDFFEILHTSATPLSDTDSTLFLDSGRSAIRLSLQNINPPQKRAVLPAYTCETVILPFIEAGYEIELYNVDRNLLTDAHRFRQMVEGFNPAVILAHACFGFDTIQNIREYLRRKSNEGTIIIEDLTHSLFMKRQLPCADYYVGSLRKWSGIPDGGFITVCNDVYRITPPAEENTPYLDYRCKAQALKRQYAHTPDADIKAKYRALFAASEKALDSQNRIYTMSAVTRRAIMGIDYDRLIRRRRDNYKFLLEGLSGMKKINIPAPLNGQADAPLYLAFLTEDRDALQAFMAAHRIYLPVIWPVPSQVVGRFNTDTEYIYANILAVPCDQRYEISDMNRVLEAIYRFFGRSA